MPNQDGTGPRCEGPLTGRGFGKCNSENTSERIGRGPCGRGLRRGLGNRFKTESENKNA